MTTEKKLPLVMYHGSCLDGWGSAYAAWCEFRMNAEYLPVHHGRDYDFSEHGLSVYADRDVYIFDFSFDKIILEEISKVAKRLVICDHHVSAQQNVEFALQQDMAYGTFNLEKSGAVLAWEYLHPTEPVPELLLWIQDRDLWQWKRTDTAAMTSALMLHLPHDTPTPQDFERMHLAATDSSQVLMLIDQGQAINAYRKGIVDYFVSNASVIDFGGLGDEVPVVNCPPQFASEVGNELSLNAPFAVMWSEVGNERRISLRSSDKYAQPRDVSELAQIFGGGGHARAAGFSMNLMDEAAAEEAGIKDLADGDDGEIARLEIAANADS